MDLNYLLHRHQVSLIRAKAASGPEARRAHRGMVKGYATAIHALQTKLGARARLGTD